MTTTHAFDFGHQNLNGDGRPTNLWQSRARILVTTETNNPPATKPPVGRVHWRSWLPVVNPSLAVCLRRRQGFLRDVADDATQTVRYHGTGANEGWSISTPARHAYARDINLYGHDATVIVTHLLNKQAPAKERQRDEIWYDIEWPKLVALVEETQQRGRLVLLGGDFNRRTLPHLAGLRELTGPGTDHLLVSEGPILGDGLSIGPETGKSGRVHHTSQTAHLRIKERKR